MDCGYIDEIVLWIIYIVLLIILFTLVFFLICLILTGSYFCLSCIYDDVKLRIKKYKSVKMGIHMSNQPKDIQNKIFEYV